MVESNQGILHFIKSIATHRHNGTRRKKDKNRVLVVGGAGYVGSLLVRRLLEQGYQVRVLDAAIYGNTAIEELIGHPRFEFVEGDLRDLEALVYSVSGCEAVIHLGAIVGDAACELNEESTREINTFASKMLIQVARGARVRKLIFASTCAVYGASDHLMDERSPLNPVSLYAQSKADAEKIVLQAKSENFCPVVLRLGTLFGHSFRPRFDLVVNLLGAKAWTDKRITIYNKDQWRPFVHVHDIARALLLFLDADADVVRGEIFNVGAYNLNLTLGQVAEKVKKYLPNTRVDYKETGDRRNYRVSFDKIHAALGFSCEKTVEDGIMEVKNYLDRESAKALGDESFDNTKRLRAIAGTWLASGSNGVLNSITSYKFHSHQNGKSGAREQLAS